jgi:hypothetical protein
MRGEAHYRPIIKAPAARSWWFLFFPFAISVLEPRVIGSPFHDFRILAKSSDYRSAWVKGKPRSSRREEALIKFRTPNSELRIEMSLLTSAATPYFAKVTTARQTVTIDPCLPWARCPFTATLDAASRTAADADASRPR